MAITKTVKMHIVRGSMNYHEQRAKQYAAKIEKLEKKREVHVTKAEEKEKELLAMEESLVRIIAEREKDVKVAKMRLGKIRKARETIINNEPEPVVA